VKHYYANGVKKARKLDKKIGFCLFLFLFYYNYILGVLRFCCRLLPYRFFLPSRFRVD
jgi:hypothetical protein